MNEKETEQSRMCQSEYQDYVNHRTKEILNRKRGEVNFDHGNCECGCPLDDIGYCPRCDY